MIDEDPFNLNQPTSAPKATAEATAVAPAQSPTPSDEPAPLELGIYFGLDDRIYHADPGLGSTSIVDLAKEPPKWQYQRLRPQSEVRTEPMKWGSAFHCRVLEGKAAFDHRYARAPTPKDYPGCLNTTEDIKEFLRQYGQKLTGRKSELMERAAQLDDCPPFFDNILAAWWAERPDYEELNAQQMREVEDAVANMQRDPTLNAVMQAGTLMHGAAELSIIYEVDGVRRKARIDYALPPTPQREPSLFVDLKSFTTFRRGTLEHAAIATVYEKVMDVQAAWYLQAIEPARELMEQGKVFGDAPQDDFLERFLNAPDFTWVWIMLRRDIGMVPVLLSVPRDSPIIKDANAIIERALLDFQSYADRWGMDQLWTPPPQTPRLLQPTDFPSYNRGILHEQPEDR